MAERKISELESTTDLQDLYTIGTDKNNNSKKVKLQFVKEAADYANAQGDYAKEVADNTAGNTGVNDYPAFSASGIYSAGDVVNYNGKLYRFTAPHQSGAWNGNDVVPTSINAESQRKLTELSGEIVELNSYTFGNTSDIATLTFTDVDNYQRVLFDNNVIIKAGATINSIDIPYYSTAYLATRDGFDVNARVDVIQYPYKVTEDIYGLQIIGAGSAIVNFIYGSEMVGLVKEVEDVTSQTKSLNNKINDVYGEPIKTLSVNSESQSYQEVLFDKMIPKGSVIDYIAKSYNGTIYLTKSDGSIVEDSVGELISRTPYTTEYDIRGYLASELNCGFFFMFHPNIGVLQMRRSLNVTRDMSQLDIVKLMVVAFQVGNLDIIFETGTYEFNGAVTEFLVNNLGYDVNYGCGIPLGNNCRYFFNGSVLKFTNTYAPKQSNCFDTKLIGSSFEMHDVYIECDGYYYAIHDESNASSIPYRHLYQNIRIKGKNYGYGPFGIGTGFNTTLDFDGVVCDADSWVMHGPTNNPYNDSAKLILSVKNSYFGIPLNISSYDKERDSVEVRLFNSTFPKGISPLLAEVAKEYITFNVVE